MSFSRGDGLGLFLRRAIRGVWSVIVFFGGALLDRLGSNAIFRSRVVRRREGGG